MGVTFAVGFDILVRRIGIRAEESVLRGIVSLAVLEIVNRVVLGGLLGKNDASRQLLLCFFNSTFAALRLEPLSELLSLLQKLTIGNGNKSTVRYTRFSFSGEGGSPSRAGSFQLCCHQLVSGHPTMVSTPDLYRAQQRIQIWMLRLG